MPNKEEIVIGFSNLDEESTYAVAVRESLEAACQQHANIRLICRDNAWDDKCALENARYFVEQAVDIAIIYHINERLGPQIWSILMPIPIICIDIPIPFTTYVGIDNKKMGQQLGELLQDWVNQNWQDSKALVIGLVDSRVPFAHPRVVDALNTIEQSGLNSVSSICVDMRYSHEENMRIISDLVQLRSDQDRNILFVAYNDSCMNYALETIKTQKIVGAIACQGLSPNMVDLVQDPQHPLIMGTISYPEQYGEMLVTAVLNQVQKKRLTTNYYVPLTIIS